QVIGVVAAETAKGPYVITQWSDGLLVALDARAGSVAWRAMAPAAEQQYDGRLTGASTVYDPRSLLTGTVGEQSVVVVTSNGAVRAFDAQAGAPLWSVTLPGPCQPLAWTGAGLLVIPDCTGPAVSFRALTSGAPQGGWTAPGTASPPFPRLCAIGRSD